MAVTSSAHKKGTAQNHCLRRKSSGVSKLTSTYKTYSTVRMDMDLMDPRIIWTWGLLVGHFWWTLGSKFLSMNWVTWDHQGTGSPGFLEKLSPVSRGDSLENPPTRNGRFCHVYGWYKPSKYISNGRFTARQIINDGLENFATIAALLFPPHFNDTTRWAFAQFDSPEMVTTGSGFSLDLMEVL